MKKLVIIFIALLPLFGKGQDKNTIITLSAKAIYVDPAPTFKATVSLSPAFSSYASDGMDLEALKSHFKKALESKGIAWEDIRETPHEFGFETMGYDKEGAVYEYTTTSIEKMRRFLEIKSLGLQRLNAIALLGINQREYQTLYNNALKDAHSRATAIAAAMGKNIGRIVKVEDNNYIGKNLEVSIYYDRPVGEHIFSFNVAYETQ
jgi:hypothetical protein